MNYQTQIIKISLLNTKIVYFFLFLRNGFKVGKNLIAATSFINTKSQVNKNLVHFLDQLEEGETIYFHKLAASLELIAANGASGTN